MKILDCALQWHESGIATIPIHYRSKRPVYGWKQYQDKLPQIDEIKTWFSSRFVNLAVLTGNRGLCIIDFDDPAIWQLWQPWINGKIPELLTHTYRVKTRRGWHIYLFVDNPPDRTISIRTNEENSKNRRTLIDVKVNGYCLTVPSVHPSGHVYTALGKPSDIMTINSLEDVLPCILLERALAEIEIPQYTNGVNGHADPFESVPTSANGDPIQWIKSNRNILEFFPNAVPSGGSRWYKTLCPLHDDHSESGWIDVQRQRYGCQTCLNGSLDIIDFYALLKNISRQESIRDLAR